MTEVSPCDNEFISTVFLVPKKTGDFRSVINPLLLQLSTVQPILLPRLDNLLSLPHNPEQHPLRHKLHLAAWMLSGKLCQTRDFQSKRLTSSVHLGQQALRNSTRECGTSGLAGVINGKLIYFKLLSSRLWSS